MHRRPPHLIAALVALVASASLLACGGSTAEADAGSDVQPEADTHGNPQPDVVADATKLAPPLEPLDRKVLKLLFKVRTALADPAARPWPGYDLDKIPFYLIFRDEQGDGVRGYLVAPGQVPKSAYPVLDADVPVGVYRYDGMVDFLKSDQTSDNWADLAGARTFVVGYSAPSLKLESAWVEALADAYFERLRLFEAKWAPVLNCGLWKYPDTSVEVLALLFLEVEVIADAYAATDPKAVGERLREFHAVRKRAIELDPNVGRVSNDHENFEGAAHFCTQRLLVTLGYQTAAELTAAYAAELKIPLTIPHDGLHAYLTGPRRRWTGGAFLEIAQRLGWEVEPTYKTAQSVYDLVESKLGATTPALIEQAKKRYDYKSFEAKAEDLVVPLE